MLPRSIIRLLMIVGLAGWGLNCALAEAFIFIEQRPPFTAEDKAARFTVIYLAEQGLVQQYAGEDYQIKELQEAALSVADLFRTLAGIPLKSLPGKQDADPNLPPAQAQPGHARIMLRQSGGAEYLWEGNADKIPSALQKPVQDSAALAVKLPARGGSAFGGKTPQSSAGAFVRADILSADRLTEYRVSRLLKTIKALDDLDPILKQSLTDPFRLIPVPAGINPLAAFSVKGEASPLPLLHRGTGYEINRYSFAPPSGP